MGSDAVEESMENRESVKLGRVVFPPSSAASDKWPCDSEHYPTCSHQTKQHCFDVNLPWPLFRIETTNFPPMFGQLSCGCIKPSTHEEKT